MKTVFDLADELNTLIASGKGHLKVAGISGASGVAYEVGGVHTEKTNAMVSDMLGITEGETIAFVYLGN